LTARGRLERRLLQIAVGIGCLVPLLAGAVGVIHGPAMLHGTGEGVPRDLDSHFRYLSGLLLAAGIGFASCIRDVERKTGRFRLLGALVIAGGLGRLLGLLSGAEPGPGHLAALGMELGVVPLLVLWQARLARQGQGRMERER
jgi:uncharacterized membrane protein YfcA